MTQCASKSGRIAFVFVTLVCLNYHRCQKYERIQKIPTITCDKTWSMQWIWMNCWMSSLKVPSSHVMETFTMDWSSVVKQEVFDLLALEHGNIYFIYAVIFAMLVLCSSCKVAKIRTMYTAVEMKKQDSKYRIAGNFCKAKFSPI